MPTGWGRWEAVLAVAVVAQSALLVGGARVVTVDGPAHLAGAAALLHRADAAQTLYEVDVRLLPNLLTSLLLAALLSVVGPDGAERLLVLTYAVGLPLAMRYALRGIGRHADWLAVAAVPFAGSYLSGYGFYNFCLAVTGTLVITGVALRRRAGWSCRAAGGLALLLVLVWFTHLLPLTVAVVQVVVLALCRAWTARRDGWRTAVAAHVGPPALACLPVLALTLAWLQPAAPAGGAVWASTLGLRLLGVLGLVRPLVVWTTWEYIGSVVLAAGLLALVLSGRGGWSRTPERRAMSITVLLTTVWSAASPDRIGAAYGLLTDRLSVFPPLLLVLWAATADRSSPPRWARAAHVAPVLLLAGVVLLIGARLPTELRYRGDVAEFVSVATAVPRGSTLVSLRLWRDAPAGPDARDRDRDPLLHQAGRVAVLRGGVDVGDYQALTDSFPTRWRAATDPRRRLDPDLLGLERVPPTVDLDAGPRAVLLVGRTRADPATLRSPETVRLLQQLMSSYRLVATSTPSSLVEVWVRR